MALSVKPINLHNILDILSIDNIITLADYQKLVEYATCNNRIKLMRVLLQNNQFDYYPYIYTDAMR